MPTTREVDAARAERQRRAAEQRDAQADAPPAPRNARERRIAEAHARATARNAWRCKVEGCPILDEWQPASSREEAHREADRHYDARHATRR